MPKKRTIIIVTHDQMEAMTVADRIAIMNEGRLQQLCEEYLTLITTKKIRYRPGDRVEFEFLAEKTHLFDIETGNRIRS